MAIERKRALIAVLVTLWIASSASAQLRDGATGEPGGAIGRDALVQLRAGAAVTELDVTEAVRLSAALRIYRVRGGEHEDGAQLATRLSRAPGVTRAMPDLLLPRTRSAFPIPPDDPRYDAQWYLERLGIERAWQHTTGDPDVAIVIVDDGCDLEHPDLAAAFVGGRDVLDGDDDPRPTPHASGNSHGTACAGIVAARADNGTGIAGVCPECSLHCVRLVSDDDPPLVPVSADIAAFEYAYEVGAAVVSNSWGFPEATPVPELLAEQIEHVARDGRGGLGTLIVFAAGNDARTLSDDELPALDGVITVGAINNFDEAAPFSNTGAALDLTAPMGTFTTDIAGEDGDDPGDYTATFGGTSAACPVVAGTLGLMLSANPELTARQATAMLIETARPAPYAQPDDTGHDPTYGHGIVAPERAVRVALGLEPDPEASSSSGCGVVRRGSCLQAAIGLVLLALFVGRRRHEG